MNIAGVILNKVGGPRHEAKLREVVAHYTRIPVLGAIHKNDKLAIVERHLGLIPGNEVGEAEARIDAIADIVTAQVDIDALLAIAATAPATVHTYPVEASFSNGLRVGVAMDRAFGFYYNEDLDSLRHAGVELVPIDTLRQTALPAIDALIIGGGFPEAFISELTANTPLRADIRHKIDAGLPVYAECGGLMYLSRLIRWNEKFRHHGRYRPRRLRHGCASGRARLCPPGSPARLAWPRPKLSRRTNFIIPIWKTSPRTSTSPTR